MTEPLDELPPAPHCDQAVLHAPGECRFCDAHPAWQALRKLWGIAFTGHLPAFREGELACPSDFRRGLGEAGRWWPNNRAVRP